MFCLTFGLGPNIISTNYVQEQLASSFTEDKYAEICRLISFRYIFRSIIRNIFASFGIN